MIAMWNKNKARLSASENRLCKGASTLRREWLAEEIFESQIWSETEKQRERDGDDLLSVIDW